MRSFDVVPTILRISGAQQIQTDGHILGEVLGDFTQTVDAPVGAQAIRYGTEKRSVRMGKHKLIETQWGMELYDLESDPRERENIFDSQVVVHERLFPQLPAERDATKSNAIDEETRRQLESLGYMQ